MAAAQHHEISSSVSFIICCQRCIFGNEKSRGSADVFVQQEEAEEAEEEKEEKSQDPRRRMTLINPNDARKSCVTQNTGTCCCTSSPTGPTCTRATRYVLHSNSASERRPLVVRLFPSSQLKENSVAQVVFPSSGPEDLVIACLRLLLYHTTYIRYVRTSFRTLCSFLLDSAGSFWVDCPTTYLQGNPINTYLPTLSHRVRDMKLLNRVFRNCFFFCIAKVRKVSSDVSAGRTIEDEAVAVEGRIYT